ncbi:MAG: hypothetical protein EB168_04540 [Euryarchaeota archaeon]|nr:hypothetical protein [Euryarchaeota archaeon]
MGRKLNLTRQILKKIDSPPSEELALMTWWANIREDGGMGLTEDGFILFIDRLKLKHYDWELPAQSILGNRIVLAMDRKMEFPYYIKRPRGKKMKGMIYLFGERDAVMLNLCGSLSKFVENTLQPDESWN